MEEQYARKQINMKNARVWHFVVYKLIYETIRVFPAARTIIK